MVKKAVNQLMTLYPRIYFACHTRHVADPKTRRILSAHQASILDHLDEVDPTGVNELAAHMDVTASTMSLALDRLERQGYVRRVRDPEDGRRVGILLTKGGLRIKAAKSVLDPLRVKNMLRHLTAEQQQVAIGGLTLLAGAAVREMYAHRKSNRAGGEQRYGRLKSGHEISRHQTIEKEKKDVDVDRHRIRRTRGRSGHARHTRTAAPTRSSRKS